MVNNFDYIWGRKGTNCKKWDSTDEVFGREDVLPLWVADMDFAVPEEVSGAIKKRTEHPIYGYSGPDEDFYEGFKTWVEKRHGWEIEKDWIVVTPGVVPGMSFALNSLTEKGDKVIIQTPVYPPFHSLVKNNSRKLVVNPLKPSDNGYRMDLEHLESVIDDSTRMLFFCSPHNPVGRVWKKEELDELIRICEKHNVTLVSDEIWSDLVFSGYKHIPTALAGENRENIITCMAPSKTFNIAGLKTSVMVVPDQVKREKIKAFMQQTAIGSPGIFGIIAFTEAYKNGEQWLVELLRYLEGNVEFLFDYLEKYFPQIKAIRPEGTYVVWLDFREMGMEDEALGKKLIHEAKVGFSPGRVFGEEGKGFQRINIGCPREILKDALERLRRVF